MKLDHQIPYDDVERLRVLIYKNGISVGEAAESLGISRTALSLMLNQQAPMRLAYGLALRQIVSKQITGQK